MPAPVASPDVQVQDDFFSNAGSLQDNFRKFREAKLQEAAAKKKKGVSATKKRSQAEKDALREKWIARCKHYLGVPYAKRYYPADEYPQDYERGDFLDCCGLLRQASADLENEWGWKLGRWNQTYQFALCPADASITSEKDLKPGDLIFYEATYHDAWRKAQHWNITHIEVYLGPDKQTIGSRWKQRVSLHDTYELGTDDFPSKLWTVHKFHYRSLEPWLDSYTLPEFVIPEAYDKFPVMPPPSNHKSIFYVEDLPAEDAGEEDETTRGTSAKKETLLPVDD